MRVSLKTKISTRRLPETRGFYESVFGMVITQEWGEPNGKDIILAVPDGASEADLEICNTNQVRDFSGLSLQFKIDSMGEFIARLPAETAHEGPKSRLWGATYLYLTDPNGIQVIVYEGGF